MNIDQTVQETIELLLFDIRGKRDATSWMTCRVFMPAAENGDVDLATKMKIAFFGGPVMALVVLDAGNNLPFGDAQRLVDQEVLLQGKLQAAIEFRLSEATAPQFLKTYLNYNLARQKLDFAREKFQHKCELEQRKHETETRSKQQSDDNKDNDNSPEPQADATPGEDKVTKDVKLVA